MDFEEALGNQLTERQRLRDGNVERVFSRKQIEQAFLESFELVGGIPRLATWANKPENYGQFLKLLVTMAPKEKLEVAAGNVIEYRSNIPSTGRIEGLAGGSDIIEVN